MATEYGKQLTKKQIDMLNNNTDGEFEMVLGPNSKAWWVYCECIDKMVGWFNDFEDVCEWVKNAGWNDKSIPVCYIDEDEMDIQIFYR